MYLFIYVFIFWICSGCQWLRQNVQGQVSHVGQKNGLALLRFRYVGAITKTFRFNSNKFDVNVSTCDDLMFIIYRTNISPMVIGEVVM